MLWTIISQNDMFYSAENYTAPANAELRSSNPFDYLNNGYFLDNASLYGGQNRVVFNCDISGRRTGSNVGTACFGNRPFINIP